MNARQRAKKWKRLAQENQRRAREYDDLVYKLRLAYNEQAVMKRQWTWMKRTIAIDNLQVPPEFRDDVAKTKLARESTELLSEEGCIKKTEFLTVTEYEVVVRIKTERQVQG